MPSDPVRGKARARYPEPSYEEQREAMMKVAGGGKVVVERVVSGSNTFGGQCPPAHSKPLTTHQIAVLLDEEHQRHKARVEKIIDLLRRTDDAER